MSAKSYEKELKRHIVETYEGIYLCDFTLKSNQVEEFTRFTRLAVDLVRKHDNRRFQRIRNYCRYIVNTELISFASYHQGVMACHVDFKRIPFEDNQDWYLLCYASTLVHEATHGNIAFSGIPYDKHHRVRIERICHEEERRFVSRIQPEIVDYMPGKFNEQFWHGSWNRTKWNSIKLMYRRLIE